MTGQQAGRRWVDQPDGQETKKPLRALAGKGAARVQEVRGSDWGESLAPFPGPASFYRPSVEDDKSGPGQIPTDQASTVEIGQKTSGSASAPGVELHACTFPGVQVPPGAIAQAASEAPSGDSAGVCGCRPPEHPPERRAGGGPQNGQGTGCGGSDRPTWLVTEPFEPADGGENAAAERSACPLILIYRGKGVAPERAPEPGYRERAESAYDRELQEGSRRIAQGRVFAASRELQEAFPDRADRLGKCGLWVMYFHYLSHPEQPLLVQSGKFCRQPLLCSWCAMGRGARIARRITERSLQRLIECPELVPYLGTLTLRNGESLVERFEALTGAIRLAMQRRKNFEKGLRGSTLLGLFDGGSLCVEVKRGKGSGLWHPHVHFVALGRRGLTVHDIRKEWAELLGQEHASVSLDVVKQYSEFVQAGEDLHDCKKLLRDKFSEVCKYPLKFGDLTPSDRIEAFAVLQRRHLVRSFGSFRGIDVSDEVTDSSPDEMKDYSYLQRIARWDGNNLRRESDTWVQG